MRPAASFPNPGRWGGLALMLGALMFALTKTRGYVDPDDSMLGFFMFVGFALWIVGLAALYARYAPVVGRLGKAGLGVSIAGIGLLAAGHPFAFMTGPELFLAVALGTLAMTVGPLLFGVAALRGKALPRRLKVVPLLTGLVGVGWLLNPAVSLAADALARGTGLAEGIWFHNNDEVAFFVFRTLFAAGWLLMGYALWSDGRGPDGRLAALKEIP